MAKDELYDKALAIVRKHKRASAAQVQRMLGIGYGRAFNMLEYASDPRENTGISRLPGSETAHSYDEAKDAGR
jgi:DNA segregation ATPase FtsK/SpoIIIE-like protein